MFYKYILHVPNRKNETFQVVVFTVTGPPKYKLCNLKKYANS